MAAGRERCLGAGQQVGDGALADGDTEHLVEQLGQPLKANCLGDMQVDDQRHQAGAKGEPGARPSGAGALKPRRQHGQHATMAVNARDDRPNRRQFDVVIGVKTGLIGRVRRMLAMRAALGEGLDDPVWIGRRTLETRRGGPCAFSRRGARPGLVCALARAVPRSCPGFWAAARAWLRVRRRAGSIRRSAPPAPAPARSDRPWRGSRDHPDTS